MAEPVQQGVIIGVFEQREQAEQALDALRNEGHDERNIGFTAPDERGQPEVISHTAEEPAPSKHVGSGIAGGSALGGALGAAATGLIPGVGPIIAAGILAGVAGGAAVGGATGAFAGVMMDMGVDEQVAQTCEDELRAGRSIVMVQVEEDSRAARSILQRHGGRDVTSGQH